MGRRSIIIFWLLLLIPTLLIAVGAVRLLRHEQARINSVRVTAARDRGGALADSLQITLAAVKEELLVSLQAVSSEGLLETLSRWEAENYLVRNVFVWDPDQGLRLPVPGAGVTREEQSFINRYDALFEGRIGWPAGSENLAEAGAAVPDSDRKPSPLVQSITQLKTSRQRMVQAAKAPLAAGTMADAAPGPQSARGGWIPWFTENRLHILGWAQKHPDGPVYGLELELMALLSRMVPEFSVLSETGAVYVLRDGSGNILCQSSGSPVTSRDKPEFTISLAPQLPHWQVGLFFTGGRGVDASASSFLLLASLLLGIFIAAILSGGGLLTWQALRNLKDARQKTTFVSNVSHELKTPLTSILMYAELLLEGRIANKEKRSHYLKVIVDESRRLTRLVNNVLDFSRLEQGRKTYNRRRIDIGRSLAEIVARQEARLEAAALKIDLDAVPSRYYADIDRDALDQVMMNLIDNATKYAGQGGCLSICLSAEKGQLLIRVTDQGPGVPVDFRGRLFSKFQRADDSLTTSKPGSGLGLSIARQLARDHGGDVHYEPGAKRGSCFCITLPRKDQTDAS